MDNQLLDLFTRNSNTLDYMVVMKYEITEENSLRKFLPSISKEKWHFKLRLLYNLIGGLYEQILFDELYKEVYLR